MISRRVLYGSALVIFLLTIAMTFGSILVPDWISYTTPEKPPTKQIHYSYGLHSYCTTTTTYPNNSTNSPQVNARHCTLFPTPALCHKPDNGSLCSIWRSAGFLASFAVIIEMATLICFTILLVGSKQKREKGWKVLVGLLGITAVVQCAAMAAVIHVWRTEERFAVEGWMFGMGWGLGLVSWAMQLLVAGVVAAVMLFGEQEGGYELIPDRSAGHAED